MNGRNGFDNLFYALFAAAVMVFVINCFVNSFILQFVIWIILGYAFFRAFSRNIEARRRENQSFNRLATRIKEKRNVRRRRKADYTHIYKKCPQCKSVLRLPRRPGKHKTVCPKCNKEFSVKVR